MIAHPNRRQFLISSAAAGLGMLGASRSFAASPNGKLRVLSIGVIGTIGETDRRQVASHPLVEITGLCDVDANALAKASTEHPKAFTCRDYREAFEKHGDKFDAVIVSTPDHTHALILLTAMAHDKHVYGQKPLVHQLEELVMVDRALKAKPNLVTQLGNQRMSGRRAALELLRQGRLGKIVEAYAWTSAGSPGDSYFNTGKILRPNPNIPANLDWDLWLGPCEKMPYHDELAPVKWRSWWNFGSNGLGDWGCHVLDVIFLAYPELLTPFSVKSDCPEAAGPNFHISPCRTTMTYKVGSDKFSGNTFKLHYCDTDQRPTAEQLRLPEIPSGGVMTVIVGEKATITLEAEGRARLFIDGKFEEGGRMEGLPKFAPLNHWHAWVDNCLGKKTELLTPFSDAVRITEATILGVKASRFPGQELHWDKASLSFTNHKEATDTIVRRKYRDGFTPPKFA
jgi:predicted dehydrogenase